MEPIALNTNATVLVTFSLAVSTVLISFTSSHVPTFEKKGEREKKKTIMGCW